MAGVHCYPTRNHILCIAAFLLIVRYREMHWNNGVVMREVHFKIPNPIPVQQSLLLLLLQPLVFWQRHSPIHKNHLVYFVASRIMILKWQTFSPGSPCFMVKQKKSSVYFPFYTALQTYAIIWDASFLLIYHMVAMACHIASIFYTYKHNFSFCKLSL